MLEAADGEAQIAGFEPWFIVTDPRELDVEEDFDIVPMTSRAPSAPPDAEQHEIYVVARR